MWYYTYIVVANVDVVVLVLVVSVDLEIGVMGSMPACDALSSHMQQVEVHTCAQPLPCPPSGLRVGGLHLVVGRAARQQEDRLVAAQQLDLLVHAWHGVGPAYRPSLMICER